MRNAKPIDNFEDLKTYNNKLKFSNLSRVKILQFSVEEDVLVTVDKNEKYCDLPLMETMREFVKEPRFYFENPDVLSQLDYSLLSALAFPRHFQNMMQPLVANLILMGTGEIELGKLVCGINSAKNNSLRLYVKGYEGDTLEKIYLPSFIDEIAEEAFNNKSKLKYVVSYSKGLKIGRKAFYRCQNLVEVVTTNGISSLDDFSFWQCISLENIEFNENLSVIPSNAFSYCNSLTKIKLPRGLKEIKKFAFQSCGSLKTVDFSACRQLTTIEGSAFSSSPNIDKIEFKNCRNLKTLGSHAFAYCNDIKVFDMKDTKVEKLDLCELLNHTLAEVISYPKTYHIEGMHRELLDLRGYLGQKKKRLIINNFPEKAIEETVESFLNVQNDEKLRKLYLATFIIALYENEDPSITREWEEFSINGMTLPQAQEILKAYANKIKQ